MLCTASAGECPPSICRRALPGCDDDIRNADLIQVSQTFPRTSCQCLFQNSHSLSLRLCPALDGSEVNDRAGNPFSAEHMLNAAGDGTVNSDDFSILASNFDVSLAAASSARRGPIMLGRPLGLFWTGRTTELTQDGDDGVLPV